MLSEIARSVLVLHPWDCVPGYLDWFTSISHVQVQNLTHRSKHNPRTKTSANYRQLQFRIDSALSILRSMLEIGYNEATPTRDMLCNAMKKITQVLEGQQSTEEHTPSENLVYTRRRKHGATS